LENRSADRACTDHHTFTDGSQYEIANFRKLRTRALAQRTVERPRISTSPSAADTADQPPRSEIFFLGLFKKSKIFYGKIPRGADRDRHAASRETVAMVDGRWSMVAGQCPAADDRTDACSLYDVLHRACAAEDAISKMRRRAACRCNG
jgi:hypothetical protein